MSEKNGAHAHKLEVALWLEQTTITTTRQTTIHRILRIHRTRRIHKIHRTAQTTALITIRRAARTAQTTTITTNNKCWKRQGLRSGFAFFI